MDSGEIDAAVVAGFSEGNPIEAESVLARQREDIISAMGSKYCPTTVARALEDALESRCRFAFVGLPCQVQGLRKAQQQSAALREAVRLVVGLFCSRVPTLQGVSFMLQQYGVSPTEVASLAFRSHGWPGMVEVEDARGEVLTLGEFPEIWANVFGSDHFTMERCLLCADPVAALADVSCGDPWLPEYRGRPGGATVAIVRSRAGMAFIRRAQAAGVLALAPAAPERVAASQGSSLRRKRRNLLARYWWARRLAHSALPTYADDTLTALRPTLMGCLFGWLPYFSLLVGRSRLLRRVWWRLPRVLRMAYGKLYSSCV
jgi:coenzyme F420 hydrogenase subunit beta